ncbi:MAG: hypothetical protein H6729_10965 [Deltaproteobacteria bacterium]|nr:hypothetical protein [Deltaproteobacteria bacterium]
MKIACWKNRRRTHRISRGCEISSRQTQALFAHLTQCVSCRRQYDALMFLRRKVEGGDLSSPAAQEMVWLTPVILERSKVSTPDRWTQPRSTHPIFRWGALASVVSLLFIVVLSRDTSAPRVQAELQARGDIASSGRPGVLGIRVFCEHLASEGGKIVVLPSQESPQASDAASSEAASCAVGETLHFAVLLPADGKLEALEWADDRWTAMHPVIDAVKQPHLKALPIHRRLGADDEGELRLGFRLKETRGQRRWNVERRIRVTARPRGTSSETGVGRTP